MASVKLSAAGRLAAAFFCASLFSQPTFAQPTITLTGPPIVRPGAPVTITATLAGGSSPAEAGISLTLPAALPVVSAAINPAITAKTLYCSDPVTNPGFITCLLVGATATAVNAGPIPDGILLTWTGTVTPGATGSLVVAVTPGNGSVQLLSGTQQLIIITPPSTLTIPIVSACDLNGDGKTDGADVVLLINWVLGRLKPPAGQTCDVNSDGRCDLLDVAVILTAALGGACGAH